MDDPLLKKDDEGTKEANEAGSSLRGIGKRHLLVGMAYLGRRKPKSKSTPRGQR